MPHPTPDFAHDFDTPYRVPALEKGLDVLELLAHSFVPLSLTEISQQCGRKVSEMQRMIGYLHARGYLVRDNLGGYRLSSRMFRLASLQPPFQHLLTRAMPHMEAFVAETGESVHLCILEKDDMLVLGESTGYVGGTVSISVRTGSRQPAEQTVSGRLLLAGLTPEQLRALGSRRNLSAKALAALAAQLAAIKAQGHDGGASIQMPGVHDLGVPVLAGGMMPIAALTTTYLSSHENPKTAKKLLEALQQTAAGIGAEMEPPPGRA